MWDQDGDKRKASKKKKKWIRQALVMTSIEMGFSWICMSTSSCRTVCVCLRVLEVSMMDVVLVLSSEVEVVLGKVQVVNSNSHLTLQKKKRVKLKLFTSK